MGPPGWGRASCRAVLAQDRCVYSSNHSRACCEAASKSAASMELASNSAIASICDSGGIGVCERTVDPVSIPSPATSRRHASVLVNLASLASISVNFAEEKDGFVVSVVEPTHHLIAHQFGSEVTSPSAHSQGGSSGVCCGDDVPGGDSGCAGADGFV